MATIADTVGFVFDLEDGPLGKYTRSIVSTLTLADAAYGDFKIVLGDSFGVSLVASQTAIIPAQTTMAMVLSDLNVSTRTSVAKVSDSFLIFDRSKQGWVFALSEILGLSVAMKADTVARIVERIGFLDRYVSRGEQSLSLYETLRLRDAPSLTGGPTAVISESLSITDSTATALSLALVETLALVEMTVGVAEAKETLAQDIVLSEAVSSGFVVSLVEALGLEDSVESGAGLSATVEEALALMDGLPGGATQKLAATIAESLGLADAQATQVVLGLLLKDAIDFYGRHNGDIQ